MDSYKYETHVHTKGPSACGVATGTEQARFLKENGYQGFVVTDHFFNGNSGVPKDLDWADRVELFCKGYEEAKEEGDRIGIDVFFGMEWNFHNDEFLLYGISKDWILQHPDMLSWSHAELFQQINLIGGCMIQAHPFRVRDYVKGLLLYPYLVHGIEATNAENVAIYDCFAYKYAKYYHLAMTSGSDLHRARNATRDCRGILSETCWSSISDFIKQIKSQSGYTLITSEDSIAELDGTELVGVPVTMFDENEQVINEEFAKIFINQFDLKDEF